MAPFTKDTLKMALGMVQELNNGQTGLSTKENGDSTRQTAKANSGMPMAMCTRDSGKMTKQTGTVSTSM